MFWSGLIIAYLPVFSTWSPLEQLTLIRALYEYFSIKLILEQETNTEVCNWDRITGVLNFLFWLAVAVYKAPVFRATCCCYNTIPAGHGLITHRFVAFLTLNSIQILFHAFRLVILPWPLCLMFEDSLYFSMLSFKRTTVGDISGVCGSFHI